MPAPARLVARAAIPALALLAPAVAAAQPALTAPGIAAAPAAAPETSVPERYKPDTALGLSLGITLGGLAVSVAGSQSHTDALSQVGGAMFFLGPSAGHWYAGDYLTTGLGMRLAGSGLALMGLIMAVNAAGDGDAGGGVLLVMAGAGLYVGGAVHDIATAPRAARRKNRALAAQVAISPTVTRDSAGLAVLGSF